MKTKSVVLKSFEQSLNMAYNGATVKNYLFHASSFLDFCDNVPERVNNEDFLNYNIHLSNSDFSYSYRNVAINAVNAYFRLYLRKSVKKFASIRPPKQKKLPKDIPFGLLMERIDDIKSPKSKLIMLLGIGCGLRSNEIIDLRLKDIDIENQTLLVNGKGNKERLISFSDNLRFHILNYVEYYNPVEYLFNGKTNQGEFKEKYSSSSILKLVKKHIGKYTYHQIRHTHATQLLRNGVPIDEVSKRLGHSKLETTMIYNHIKTTDIKKELLPT